MTQNGFGTPPIFSNLHKNFVTVLRSETYQAIMIHLSIITHKRQVVKVLFRKKTTKKPHLARKAPCVVLRIKKAFRNSNLHPKASEN